VTNNDTGDEGTISDIPWAAVFDPAVNVRVLGEIQARGFRAATDLVDRFVRQKTADTNTSASQIDPQQEPSRIGSTLPDVDQMFGVWQRLIGQAVQSLRDAASPHAGTTFDFIKGGASGHISLETWAGGALSSEVWLHNSGPEDLGMLRLRCSDLLAHDGAVIASNTVRFEPDVVPMVARSSRGVTMQIAVGNGVPPGCYRGTLLADGHPDAWLSVVLNVLPAS
jgi:hypothetical protein